MNMKTNKTPNIMHENGLSRHRILKCESGQHINWRYNKRPIQIAPIGCDQIQIESDTPRRYAGASWFSSTVNR